MVSGVIFDGALKRAIFFLNRLGPVLGSKLTQILTLVMVSVVIFDRALKRAIFLNWPEQANEWCYSEYVQESTMGSLKTLIMWNR